jgi:hypothetical protein
VVECRILYDIAGRSMERLGLEAIVRIRVKRNAL